MRPSYSTDLRQNQCLTTIAITPHLPTRAWHGLKSLLVSVCTSQRPLFHFWYFSGHVSIPIYGSCDWADVITFPLHLFCISERDNYALRRNLSCHTLWLRCQYVQWPSPRSSVPLCNTERTNYPTVSVGNAFEHQSGGGVSSATPPLCMKETDKRVRRTETRVCLCCCR